MKKLKITLTIVLITVWVNSCNTKDEIENSQVKRIALDTQKDNIIALSDHVSNIEYIPLEYTNSSLLATIDKVIYHDNKFFVLDKKQKAIVIFSKEGQYLNKISKVGPGPEEYSGIDFFDIDKESNEIVLYDISTGKIYRYGINGKSTKSINARIICRDFNTTNDGGYLFYSPDETNVFNNQLFDPGVYYMDEDGRSLTLLKKIGKMEYIPLITPNSFTKVAGKTTLFSNYIDTIYTFSNKEIVETIYLDYDVKLKESSLMSPPGTDFTRFNFPLLKLSPIKSNNFISYLFIKSGKSYFSIIKNSHTSIAERIYNDIDGGHLVLFDCYLKDEDQIISVLSESNLEAILNQTQENKNFQISSNIDPLRSNYKFYEAVNYVRSNKGNPVLIISTLRK